MATITDVANEAGVSLSTVSRVLNNNVFVSDEKRELVLKAMKKVGYQPSSKRVVKYNKNKVILVVTSILLDSVISGIEEAASDLGYIVLIEYIGLGSDGYARCSETLKTLRNSLCGVILVNVVSRDENIPRLFGDIPVVQIGEYYELNPTYVVLTDDEKASYDITKHVIGTGKNRIAYVSTSSASSTYIHFAQQRLAGYRRALLDSGIQPDDSLVYKTDLSIEGGREAARYFTSLPQPPDAICCITDLMAVGCISELKKLKMQIPEQIAVAGFDNLEYTEVFSPSITTISQNFDEMGAQAVDTLDRIIQGRLTKGQTIYISHELIEREST